MAYTDPNAYEGYMGRWSVRLAPRFIGFAGITDCTDVLDVGCGTGNLALALADVLPNAQVIGVDPSADFIVHARTRCANNRLRFEIGDAGSLPFADGSFDATLAQLVIQTVPDKEAAMIEMRRVTRPGGRIAACLWDFVSGMEMMTYFWDAVSAVDPEAAANRRQRAGLESREALAGLFSATGLTAVESVDLIVPIEFVCFADYWQPFLSGATPTSDYAKSLPRSEQTAIREKLRRDFLGNGPDRPIAMQARAWAARGLVPG